jgi:NADH-quinone oxidoreductase subunit J
MAGIETLTAQVVFYLFSALMIGGAALVVLGRNLIHAAFALLLTFFGVAVFYVLLGADFLAGTQVLIYVGGILILLLFGVMLTHRIYDLNLKTEVFQLGPGLAVAATVFGTLAVLIYRTPWKKMGLVVEGPTTETLGRLFLTDYVLPFEVASVLLLAALMGAAMLVRRRTDL